MPITGKFEADFASFVAAVDGAETKLRSFETGASKVEGALGRMTDSFSGRKVIQDATLMSEAVERIGGTSKLTEGELARMGTVANEALSKMKALGLEIPPGLQKIADETKNIKATHESLVSSLTDVAAAFGIAFSVERAVSFVNDTLHEADALKTLGQQTQINVEELQVLAGATREYGIDADELGRGLFGLSQKIAGGDATVATGLHKVGLSLDEVRGKNGMELFLTIEHALGQLQGQLRDTAAADLFGQKLGAAMGGFAKEADEAIDKSRRLNTIISTDSVNAAADYASEIDRLNKNLHSAAIEMEGKFAGAINVLSDATDKGASKWRLFIAAFQDAVTSAVTGQEETRAMRELLDGLNRSTEAATDAKRQQTAASREHVAALTAEQQAAQFMASLDKDSSVALEGYQLKDLAHLKEIGELNAQNAAAVGVNAAQFSKYSAELVIAEAAQKKETEALEKYQKAALSLQDVMTGPKGIPAAVAQAATEFLRLGASQSDVAAAFNLTTGAVAALATELAKDTALQKVFLSEVNAQVVAELEAQTKLNAAVGRDAAGAIIVGTNALRTYQLALEELHLKKQEGISQAAQEQLLLDNYTRALYTEAVAQDADTAALARKNAETARVPGLLAAATAAAQQYSMASQFALNPRSNDLAGDAAARGGQLAYDDHNNPYVYIPGVNMPPRRAMGGPVNRDEPTWVGERGPELYVPPGNGSIVPNGAAGAGVRVTNNFNGVLLSTDPAAKRLLADLVSNALLDSMRAQGMRPGL